jgi:hypothetical protein
MSDRHVYNLAYYQKNKEKLKADTKAYRLKNLKKVKLCIRRALYGKFGWTLEWHRAQLKKYKRCCAICLKRKVLCVDHKGKKLRGLLCKTCNSMLGLVYDNPKTLQRAARYVIRNR